jgi:hypothetical protein
MAVVQSQRTVNGVTRCSRMYSVIALTPVQSVCDRRPTNCNHHLQSQSVREKRPNSAAMFSNCSTGTSLSRVPCSIGVGGYSTDRFRIGQNGVSLSRSTSGSRPLTALAHRPCCFMYRKKVARPRPFPCLRLPATPRPRTRISKYETTAAAGGLRKTPLISAR